MEDNPMESPELTKTLYLFAYRLYENSKYSDAVHFFRFLTIMEPHASKHWKGLGASLQMQNEHENAIEAYCTAMLIEGSAKDASLQRHVADCYFALGKNEEGQPLLENNKENYG